MSDTPIWRKPAVIGAAAGIVALLVGLAIYQWGRSSVHSSTAAPVTSVATKPKPSATTRPGGTVAKTTPVTKAPGGSVPRSGLTTVTAAELPPEARTTLDLIASNGPYPYSRDGVVYSNIEKILPKQKSGYYHEYTVVTPGASTRGTRRIVTGQAGEKFYTDDHYASFREIVG